MQTFETEHYTFHYGANTAAERDIEKIAALQESCFSHICAVLGLTPDFKIEYFLCDSPEEVGRICGDDEPCNGFADLPSRIYAVYNETVQCVGFHRGCAPHQLCPQPSGLSRRDRGAGHVL